MFGRGRSALFYRAGGNGKQLSLGKLREGGVVLLALFRVCPPTHIKDCFPLGGKGVPAAIFMAISRTVIRAIALTENSASMCMQRSNNILCQESVNDMFVTVFYGILNIHTGTVTYSNAGHNPPILMKKDGSVSKVPSTGDMILGAINDASYHEKELKMSPGDNLFLYTDGVTEAMNTKHELYSEQRLLENCRTLAGKNPKEVVEKITETVGEFVVGAVQSDDITLLSISYKG